MKPEAMRVAIAEACGWKDVAPCVCGLHPSGIDPNGARKESRTHIPDYTGDLNAIHDAENKLSSAELIVHRDNLAKMFRYRKGYKWSGGFKEAITASALQRATALVKTLNLWQD